MGNVAKGCLIAALIMIAAGFVCVAASSATGGFGQTITMIEDGALSIGPEYALPRPIVSTGSVSDADGVAASEVKNLNIDIASGFMEINTSESDTIHIEVSEGRYSRIDCYVKDRTLHIVQESTIKNVWRRHRRSDNYIVLYIPEDCELKNADIDLGAGEIDLSNLRIDNEMDIDVGAGQIIGEALSIAKLDVDVGAGEAVFNASDAKNAKFSVAMGSVEYDGTIAGDLEADCGMGSISITLNGSMEEYNYSMDCSMGSIELDGRSYSGVINGMQIDNGADNEVEIDCAMGSVAVSFKEE